MSSWTWRTGLASLAILAAFHGVAAQPSQPYAGMQSRPIKALSDQQIADLRIGRGMSLALAAELNGYPGPIHLLELADQLKLTAEQRAHFGQMLESMKREAIPIGQQLIAREADLDRRFAERTITPDALQTAVAEVGAVQAELRAAHLKYHLSTPALLTEDQMRRYAELRGYAGGPRHGRQRHHHAN